MPEYFFILGLPRSRTAWLSNWFTTRDSICLHDPSRLCAKSGAKQLHSILHKSDAFIPWNGWYDDTTPKRNYYGSADSVNGWWFSELENLFPNAKFALIERNYDEVAVSCERLFGDPCTKELDALQNLHEKLRGYPNVKCVDYDRLNHAGVVQDLQRWLTPKLKFDYSRFELLNGLDVTINHKKYVNAK
jgi:hypothetical protein|tara:strand:- start:4145 stop:4711 length:567 start_codon:yes stop_codon:yes gene_type:complete